MIIERDDPKIHWLPFDREPQNYDTVIVNTWWICDPAKGLVTYAPSTIRTRWITIQGNTNQKIAELARDKMYPWAEIRFVPIAYVPLNSPI